METAGFDGEPAATAVPETALETVDESERVVLVQAKHYGFENLLVRAGTDIDVTRTLREKWFRPARYLPDTLRRSRGRCRGGLSYRPRRSR